MPREKDWAAVSPIAIHFITRYESTSGSCHTKNSFIRCSPDSDSSDVSCKLMSCVGDFFVGTWRAALATMLPLLLAGSC